MQTAAIYMCPIGSLSGEAQWGQDRNGEPVDDGPQAFKAWMEAKEGDGEQTPGCETLTQPAWQVDEEAPWLLCCDSCSVLYLAHGVLAECG